LRGEIAQRAMAIEKELKWGLAKPFDKVIYCNIGNPQQLDQTPVTFARQIIALVNYPALMENPDPKLFSGPVLERARQMLAFVNPGAYSESQGIQGIRQEVADFIARRDGYPSDADDIFLTDGASPAVQMCIRATIAAPNDAIMIPIPQYPLYSASISMSGGMQVGYFLDEENDWGLCVKELERAYDEAVSNGTNVRSLCVINPGNPTGQCMTEDNMRGVLEFCYERNLVLLADEVYQTNTYSGNKTSSFKKVMCDMGAIASEQELISFHSVSKGFWGECGRRGGYMELVNVDEEVKNQLYKLASVSLCSNVEGQMMVSCMVNPVEDCPIYKRQKYQILASLERRAEKLSKAFNSFDGISCNFIQGAMYAFPILELPPKALAAAKAQGKTPDLLYCLALLERTGIVCVAGDGFGQREGTLHLRCTILPPEDDMDNVISRFGAFHSEFMDKYS